MNHPPISFVSHTNAPGGAELGLRRYLDSTSLPVQLVTMQTDGVWSGLACEVIQARSLPELRKRLAASSFVVANSMRAAFITSLVTPRRIPLIYYVQDGLTESAMSPLALKLTQQVSARRAERYLANSQWTASTIQEALGVSKDRIDVVYTMSGVGSRIIGESARPRPRAPLRLLFLGRITPWKAPDIAIRALTPLRELGIEATLTIAGGSHFGEDEYAARVWTLASSSPGITLLGHVNDVQALLQSHDVLVHCSTVPEPFGQVIIQGLAAGMPVVATAHGGPVEILGDAPARVLYPPASPDQLAEAVHRAVPSYEEISAWAQRRAAAFEDELVATMTDRALTRILDAPR